MFLGWTVEAGINWKRTYYVCDIDNFKSWLEGKSTFQVLASMTVVQTGDDKFPLREAVKTQLEKLESLPVLRLEDDVAALEGELGIEGPLLPKDHSRGDIIPFEEPPNALETFSRLLQYGHSPGCGACEKRHRQSHCELQRGIWQANQGVQVYTSQGRCQRR